MRVFDETKTNELTNYDLEKGYLKKDKLFIAHHPAVVATAGSFHTILVRKYPNGGEDYEKVWDILPTKGKDAYDEYEDIQVYVPYTQKQLAEIEINELKKKLSEIDYKAKKPKVYKVLTVETPEGVVVDGMDGGIQAGTRQAIC